MVGEGYNKCKYCKEWEMNKDTGFSELKGNCSIFDKETEAREVCQLGAKVSLLDKLVITFKEMPDLEPVVIFTTLGLMIEILIAVLTPLWLTIIVNIAIVLLVFFLVGEDLL